MDLITQSSNCDQIVTAWDRLRYNFVYLRIPTDNLQISDKTDYYFVFRKLGKSPNLDPESVALSPELQAHLIYLQLVTSRWIDIYLEIVTKMCPLILLFHSTNCNVFQRISSYKIYTHRLHKYQFNTFQKIKLIPLTIYTFMCNIVPWSSGNSK